MHWNEMRALCVQLDLGRRYYQMKRKEVKFLIISFSRKITKTNNTIN